MTSRTQPAATAGNRTRRSTRTGAARLRAAGTERPAVAAPQQVGMRFRERMSGPFSWGHSDPMIGARVGGRTGWHLVLHGTVTIDDVDAFTSAPVHDGRLSGEVELPGIARRIPFTDGVFRLFVPSGRDGGSRMVYEAPLRHAGEDYYLAGHKNVHDDFGIDVWADTTTLEVRLHRGTDASGPVVGSGVLRLGVPELAALLASVRTHNAGSPLQAARALGAFAGMFARELTEAYLPFRSRQRRIRQVA